MLFGKDREQAEEFLVNLVAVPAVASVACGALVVGWQCIVWLQTAVWPQLSLRTAFNWWAGRTISEGNLLETQSAFDRPLLWLVDEVPLAVWLFAVFPFMWAGAWLVVAKIKPVDRM